MVADFLGRAIVDDAFGTPGEYGALDVLFGVYGYAIQIYADFSGYTDVAIGLALLLGFRFPQNFDRPYAAVSVQDFWRRWHMTLSRWLRDYLYVPLGGNRSGRAATYRNLVITMGLGGLWHGAAWVFVVWGLYQGLGLAIERALSEREANPMLSSMPPMSASESSPVSTAAPRSMRGEKIRPRRYRSHRWRCGAFGSAGSSPSISSVSVGSCSSPAR